MSSNSEFSSPAFSENPPSNGLQRMELQLRQLDFVPYDVAQEALSVAESTKLIVLLSHCMGTLAHLFSETPNSQACDKLAELLQRTRRMLAELREDQTARSLVVDKRAAQNMILFQMNKRMKR